MSRPLRVAVIGLGDIARVHLDAIDQAAKAGIAKLVAVADVDPRRRDAVASARGIDGFADHRQLLQAVRPDVVHVCTPHATHADIAISALDGGTSVILEKPLATSRADGERIADAAARSSTRIAVCFQNRYNTAARRAKQILESGELGPVRGATATVLWHRPATYYQASPWRGTWAAGGGGLLMNQAIHTVDLLQWLLGDVVHVSGRAGTRVLGDVIEVEDTADLVLRHADGAQSVMFATVCHVANETVTIDIRADRGRLRLDGDLFLSRADGSEEIVAEDATGTGDRAYWGGAHVRLIHDFYRVLQTPDPFWIDAREAQKALEIIQQVYDQSFPRRRAPEPQPIEWSSVS